MPGSSALIIFNPDDNNLPQENKKSYDNPNIKKENCCSYLSNCINNCLVCCFICLN